MRSFEQQSQYIKKVVFYFYQQATTDFLIAYHFKKIAELEDPSQSFLPPMEAFKNHLPRIESFWEAQLLGRKSHYNFNLLNVHQKLGIKKAEIRRWIILFKESLNHHDDMPELKAKWLEKIDYFEKVFLQKF